MSLPKHENMFPEPTTLVISAGGSLVVPGGKVDIDFLRTLKTLLHDRIKAGFRFVIVIGGGGTAREYMNAAKEVGDVSQDEMDWLGIAATRLNARLLLSVLADVAYPEVITDPTAIPEGIEQPLILCAGWKPGWSTDTVAAIAARERGAKMVLNLSNIEYVYDDDPSKNPDAKPYTEMGWDQYRAMVGNEWSPGMNAPFDPIASKIANEEGMTVVVANGRLENLTAMLSNEPFEGTILK
jgi:uridylate kinase